jgi:hypothetical protein
MIFFFLSKFAKNTDLKLPPDFSKTPAGCCPNSRRMFQKSRRDIEQLFTNDFQPFTNDFNLLSNEFSNYLKSHNILHKQICRLLISFPKHSFQIEMYCSIIYCFAFNNVIYTHFILKIDHLTTVLNLRALNARRNKSNESDTRHEGADYSLTQRTENPFARS